MAACLEQYNCPDTQTTYGTTAFSIVPMFTLGFAGSDQCFSLLANSWEKRYFVVKSAAVPAFSDQVFCKINMSSLAEYKNVCTTILSSFFFHYAPVSQINWCNMPFTAGNLFPSHSCIGWCESTPHWDSNLVPQIERQPTYQLSYPSPPPPPKLSKLEFVLAWIYI